MGFALVVALVGFLRYRLSQAQRPQKSLPTDVPTDLEQFQGLTEAEAVARRSPTITQEREQAARQVRRDIWRSRTVSIFNVGLLGMVAARALLGDPLGAWLTFGILILNIGISVAQQLYATGQVEELMALARPLATALRDDRIRSIDVDEIVVGDVLVVGPGDEFLADGELLSGSPQVVEAATVRGDGGGNHKAVGDQIRTGSYCIQGRAVYRVTAVPADIGTQRWTPVQKTADMTPLQRIITRILRLLLVLVAVFLTLLLLDWANRPLFSELMESKYRDAATVFFSISSSGLYFMIVATYALGSARLGAMGALIRESQAVESLAQVSILCLSKTGVLTSARVHLDMIAPGKDLPNLAERRVRQIVGDLAHSARIDNFFLQAISDNFAGSNRPVEEVARFLSAFGWSAVTFSEAVVPGTYVIGEPPILQPHLVKLQVPDEDEASTGDGATNTESESGLRRGISRFGRFFRRNDQKADEIAEDTVAVMDSTVASEADQSVSGATSAPDGDASTASATHRRNLYQELRLRLGRSKRPTQDVQTEEAEDEEPAPALPQLLFAYTPEPKPLFDVAGRPQLPKDLIPLCTLTFEEQIHPQALEAVGAFTEAGVDVKILSSDNPERMLGTAERLGLIGKESARQTVVSGLQLAQMTESQFERAVKEATIFGPLTPVQKGEIVRTLRQLEERVAMVGDGVGDVPAMEGASLSITLHSSCQAALSMADIVLLEDSLHVLPIVLQRGQRIVNGLLDVLKINLAQVGYVLLLILAMVIGGGRNFFYHATQGGVISFFTTILPSIGLTIWASAGALPRQYLRSRLWHFVVPAAFTMTAAALLISIIFGRTVVSTPYSQLAVTYGLIVIGLLLVVFVQPPTRFWVGGDVLSGNRRTIYMVIVLFLVFIAATYIPLTQGWFRLAPLAEARDYVAIAAVSVVWSLLIRLIWRSPWLRRRAGILSDNFARNGGSDHR